MIKVNGYEITEKEFDMACAEKSYSERKKLNKDDINMVAEMLIEASLMLEVADNEKVEVKDSDAEEMLQNVRKNFKSEDEFLDALQKSGDNLEDMTKRIERNLKLRNFVNARFFADTKVSDEDVEKYYEQYPEHFKKGKEVKASHILFNEADKDKALEVHDLILKGEDFAAHAEKHSICPSGKNGGDLGFFEKGKMVPEFEKAAFDTPVGELADIIKTQFGYHIIKITDMKPEGNHELADIKEQLRQGMVNSVVNHKIRDFVSTLKEKADIQIDKSMLESKFPE